jgi:oligopeptide transport system substrate-binding protein
MKKVITVLLIVVLVIACCSALFACNKKGGNDTLAVCLASEPQSIDPALNSAVDGATMLVHLFAGLVKYDANLKLVADAAEALPTPTIAANGEATYVFKLRDGMKWSNGEAVLASDFEWAWKRAASTALGADYGYMFEVVKGYGGDDVNGLAPLAVTADNAARTLTVTLTVDVPYFYELCAFPTYMPLYNRNNEIDADGTWATKPETYICNGAYTIKSWSHNECIVLTKNENYFDADKVTMKEIQFYLSDDASTMLANYKTGQWTFIDDVPQEEIPTLKKDYPNEFTVTGQLGTYYVCFNNNLNLLPDAYTAGKTAAEVSKANADVRKALSLLLDRTYICEEIGQAGQQPASSFVALGLTDPSNNGEEFYKHAGHSDSYVGYYDATKAANTTNAAAAVTTLKKYYNYDDSTKKFTNFPAFTYLYNNGSGHQAIGEYVQGALATYGITVNLTNQEWATFLETRKAGNYGVARNGWLGDYNDPISFLDMWTSGSGNNDVQFGKYSGSATAIEVGKQYNASALAIYSMDLSGIEGYADKSVTNGTWAQTYDALISYIKKETNTVKRYQLMHVAEDILMETGDIVPIYYYTDVFMKSTKLDGFFSSPLGYKYFMYTTLK